MFNNVVKSGGTSLTIEIKDGEVLRGLLEYRFNPLLYMIVEDILMQYQNVVITESWRPATHSGDLHAVVPVRALDLRSWIYNDPIKIEEFINKRWEYDAQRPEYDVCVFHDTGRGEHFHIQVHPNTRRA